MDYAEMSDKLVNLLGLKGKPIAVSLIKREEDIPGSLRVIYVLAASQACIRWRYQVSSAHESNSGWKTSIRLIKTCVFS
jgi:hypothetical protein